MGLEKDTRGTARSERGCCPCLRGAESPLLIAFSCCLPAALDEDLESDFHWDARQLPRFGDGAGALESKRNREIPGSAAAAPPTLSHILRKGGFLRQLLQIAGRRG